MCTRPKVTVQETAVPTPAAPQAAPGEVTQEVGAESVNKTTKKRAKGKKSLTISGSTSSGTGLNI